MGSDERRRRLNETVERWRELDHQPYHTHEERQEYDDLTGELAPYYGPAGKRHAYLLTRRFREPPSVSGEPAEADQAPAPEAGPAGEGDSTPQPTGSAPRADPPGATPDVDPDEPPPDPFDEPIDLPPVDPEYDTAPDTRETEPSVEPETATHESDLDLDEPLPGLDGEGGPGPAYDETPRELTDDEQPSDVDPDEPPPDPFDEPVDLPPVDPEPDTPRGTAPRPAGPSPKRAGRAAKKTTKRTRAPSRGRGSRHRARRIRRRRARGFWWSRWRARRRSATTTGGGGVGMESNRDTTTPWIPPLPKPPPPPPMPPPPPPPTSPGTPVETSPDEPLPGLEEANADDGERMAVWRPPTRWVGAGAAVLAIGAGVIVVDRIGGGGDPTAVAPTREPDAQGQDDGDAPGVGTDDIAGTEAAGDADLAGTEAAGDDDLAGTEAAGDADLAAPAADGPLQALAEGSGVLIRVEFVGIGEAENFVEDVEVLAGGVDGADGTLRIGAEPRDRPVDFDEEGAIVSGRRDVPVPGFEEPARETVTVDTVKGEGGLEIEFPDGTVATWELSFDPDTDIEHLDPSEVEEVDGVAPQLFEALFIMFGNFVFEPVTPTTCTHDGVRDAVSGTDFVTLSDPPETWSDDLTAAVAGIAEGCEPWSPAFVSRFDGFTFDDPECPDLIAAHVREEGGVDGWAGVIGAGGASPDPERQAAFLEHLNTETNDAYVWLDCRQAA